MEASRLKAGPSNHLTDLGKKSLEWELNDWSWDGDLFLATPLKANVVTGKGKGLAEKRRRAVPVEEDDQHHFSEAPQLDLNLGSRAYLGAEAAADLANWEGGNEKRSKLQPGNSTRPPSCQVEGCRADLSESKDYHRRHKVCEVHAKASSAVVNGGLQRFCQQCSRFHLLQEFDDEKRSCRRRLAGHNKRRRKAIPDTTTNGNPTIDNQTTSYLLISLLQILSNLHTENSSQSNDHGLLSELLKGLVTLAGSSNAKDVCDLLQASQDPQNHGASVGTCSVPNGLISNGHPVHASTEELHSTYKMTCMPSINGSQLRPVNDSVCNTVAAADTSSGKQLTETSLYSTEERVRLKGFDLNNVYCDTENCMEVNENTASPAYLGNDSPTSPCLLLESQRPSPPQMSINSDSTSEQSQPSSNGGDARGRTDRIVIKLFGKDPNDFPLSLRSQILDWLSRSPTDIESYIRPGCVILTIYLHLAELAWEELCSDLSSNLNRLLSNSADCFWRTGWVYARIQQHIAFIYNGKVLFNTPRLLVSHCFEILSVSPVAVTASSRVDFSVKVFSQFQPRGRLLCACDGKYLIQESIEDLDRRVSELEDTECLSFSCSVPNSVGRGFIEIEDHGLGSSFFPFIVAEHDVCVEIQGLENAIDVSSDEDESQERASLTGSRTRALNFLNEMGWLLRRSQLRLTSKQVDSSPNVFSLTRFRWLLAFAMDRDWCAVVKTLFDHLFQGTIDISGVSPSEVVKSEGLLHTAVRRNCRSMVEFLLRYKEHNGTFLFTPDVPGPSNITPLHLAASASSCEGVLDALTNDPGQAGLKTWRTARDITGFTPEDYARSRGHESYLSLVQKKIDKQSNITHIALNMPSIVTPSGNTYKQTDIPKYIESVGFELEKSKPTPYCKLCSQQALVHRRPVTKSLLYKPAMLAMVGIAAVCVCVALLFKDPPQVAHVFPPFRWERLEYGWM